MIPGNEMEDEASSAALSLVANRTTASAAMDVRDLAAPRECSVPFSSFYSLSFVSSEPTCPCPSHLDTYHSRPAPTPTIVWSKAATARATMAIIPHQGFAQIASRTHLTSLIQSQPV